MVPASHRSLTWHRSAENTDTFPLKVTKVRTAECHRTGMSLRSPGLPSARAERDGQRHGDGEAGLGEDYVSEEEEFVKDRDKRVR